MKNPSQKIKNVVAPKSALREWVDSIVIAVVLAIFIRILFFEPYKIPSGSMRMTLIEGDRLFVNKLAFGPRIPFSGYRLPGFTKPKRGDVVVFINPVDHKRNFIKRLIGFGGEKIEIRDGDIYVNGQHITDPRVDNVYYYNTNSEYGRSNEVVEVPAGHYFVLGDNSKDSNDSRFWGFVPERDLIGRAEFIFWPFDRLRKIH